MGVPSDRGGGRGPKAFGSMLSNIIPGFMFVNGGEGTGLADRSVHTAVASPSDSAIVAGVLLDNRQLTENLLDLGGVRIPSPDCPLDVRIRMCQCSTNIVHIWWQMVGAAGLGSRMLGGNLGQGMGGSTIGRQAAFCIRHGGTGGMSMSGRYNASWAVFQSRMGISGH